MVEGASFPERYFCRLALQREIQSWKSLPNTSAEELSNHYDLELGEVLGLAHSLGYSFDMEHTNTVDLPKIGRYQTIRPLGEGGMGIVYLAFDPTLTRKVAIKILRKDLSSDSKDTKAARSRLHREAQAMAQVSSHENIVTIYDVGTFEDQVYLSMEYVEGTTLKDWISKGASNWEDIRDMFIQASKGLDSAHQKNLIHRDFKPDNCLVSQDGIVKVMDFGLARREGHKSGMTMMFDSSGGIDQFKINLTQTGVVQGTPAYMAPEQFNQDPTSAKTDQFAFCVALFEALAGYRPFHATDYDTLQLAVTSGSLLDAPTKTQVPSWIWEAILKGLSIRPIDRWNTMRDLAGALVDPPPHLLLEKSTRRKRLGTLAVMASLVGAYTYHTEIGVYFQEPVAVDAPHIKSEKPRGIQLSFQSTLSTEDVYFAINEQWLRVAECYKLWREHKASNDEKDRTHRVEIRFEINNGTPSNFRITNKYPETTVPQASTTVGACIIGTAGLLWKFPKRLESVTVTYPFIDFP